MLYIRWESVQWNLSICDSNVRKFIALGDFWLDSVRREAIMREPSPFQECVAHLGSRAALSNC